ncbi:HAMP domain-containing sensor histidine kinase [Chryseobacterium polytrichastri]|uniref:histidine kinase n=1 Tax=Chryseobacterium polytrichastri TaxID=1302687 RepID=A0A1M6UH27_9FLAO|nr:HAMP domain-containing sensor histidine kinase [Chryseobacterium polytrichastri]SHK68487.1 Signal transduction histidine kinase [Chryseobacterium polytrichastri]
MQIKTRITLLFTAITVTILLVFALVVYTSAKESREKEFYNLLKKEAYTKANIFLNAHVDKKTLQEIYHNNRNILNEVEVAIYDTDFNLIYHDAVDSDIVKETPEMLQNIRLKKQISFYQGEWQVVGIVYQYQYKEYLITSAAYDLYGYNKLNDLLKTIIIVFFTSLVIIYIAGTLFSSRILMPIKKMMEKVTTISATNLDLRLVSYNSKDELSQLANTFNEMLDRLENSFDSQKHFVSNISHELRTPLSAMIAELEISGNKERNIQEYKTVIHNVLTDAKKLVRLSNSLLDLAKANYDRSEIGFKPIRIDEVLLDARKQTLQANSDYKIDIHFENDFEDDHQISVNGNEYLLNVAFINIFENGCKFSNDKQSIVSILFDAKKIILKFSDKGIGITETDLENIFTPFYRGENKTFADGNGIGLSLTQKIINLHEGKISVQSSLNQGTTFIIELPHL